MDIDAVEFAQIFMIAVYDESIAFDI